MGKQVDVARWIHGRTYMPSLQSCRLLHRDPISFEAQHSISSSLSVPLSQSGANIGVQCHKVCPSPEGGCLLGESGGLACPAS